MAAARTAGHDAVLWDFAALSPYETEAVPPPRARTEQRWFWETNHFKPALGALVLDRIFGAGGDSSYGAILDARTLPAVAARFDVRWAEYVAKHPDTVARVAALVQAARAQVCRTDAASCRDGGS